MAEEEILTDHVVAPKKAKEGGGGGSPFLIIGVVVLALVVVAFLLISKISGIGGIVQEGVNKVTADNARTRNKMAGKLEVEECTAEKELQVFPLTTSADGKTDEPIILNLKDGHYIRTKITLCVSSKVSKDVLKEQKDPLIYAITEVFNRKSSNDIVDVPGAAKMEKAPAAAGDDESILKEDEGIGEGGMTQQAGKSKLAQLTADIEQSLESFESLKIEHVYLPGLVVDIGQ